MLLNDIFEMDIIDQDRIYDAMNEGMDDIIDLIESKNPDEGKIHLFSESGDDDEPVLDDGESGYDTRSSWGSYSSEYSD